MPALSASEMLAYEAAIALTENSAEREFLRRGLESLAGT